MANIIRKDVVQISFDIIDDNLKQMQTDLDKLKKTVASKIDDGIDKIKKSVDGLGNSEGINKTKKDIDNLKKSVNGLGKEDGLEKIKKRTEEVGKESNKTKSCFEKMKDAFAKIKNVSVDKLKNGLSKISNKLSEISKKAAGATFNSLKKLASISFKALATGIGAAATALAVLVKQAVSSYGDTEQLVGGVETLFGAGGAKSVEEYATSVGKSVKDVQKKYQQLMEGQTIVLKNADNAYKTAGVSANDYMENVTSFSASLLTSVNGDTVKAAQIADKAMIAMADNANKMGTPLENIQSAYQGFAKQQYMLLDNLKLGYGGTKKEMERLLSDAQKITGVKYNIENLADVYTAISVIQDKLNITGTTAKEAKTTIQGSFSSMKAAYGNLLTALVTGGDSYDRCIDNMIDSVKTFASNVIPAVKGALEGIAKLIPELAPIISKELPLLIHEIIPPIIKSATMMVAELVRALPNILPTLSVEIAKAIYEGFTGKEAKENAFDGLKDGLEKLKPVVKTAIPLILGLVAAFKGFKVIKGIASVFSAFKGSSKNNSFFDAIMNTFKGLAKANTKTVLKGMANLTIILGGFTLLTAAFMFVAPYISKLSDTKSVLKLMALISALGIVGTGLVKLGEIADKIPVSTVAKGLANMAIMIAGMSALFLLIGAVSLLNFNYKKILVITGIIGALGAVGAVLSVFAGIVGLIPIPVVLLGLANIGLVIAGMSALFLLIGAVSLLNFNLNDILKITAIIGVLGTVGAILSVFAGIVGAIPIPVVLQGLANIGLVIGGLTALIVAYGKLSEISGFNAFITSGGETLANLFNQIGKIVGSLVGGIGESISNTLPAIGKNLSDFATSIQPMFSVFSGVDLSGIGTFFNTFGSFMLKMAGNDIASFFTGGTDLSRLGIELSEFAKNSSDFFTTVATFPENSFKNAKLLFQSLADIGNVPKSGGIVQWFGGETDFSALSSGLKSLASEGVVKFFTTVAELPEAGFSKAKLLFQSLADIGNIPNTGGVAQWFSGENDFAGLSARLPSFGKAMAQFYTNISGIEDFTVATKLFNALSKINDLPKEGGIFAWAKSKVNLGDIGSQLNSFATNASTFFKKINELNIENLNALFNALKNLSSIVSSVQSTVSNEFEKIANKVKISCDNVTKTVKTTTDTIKITISKTDLSSSGSTMMSSLIRGINNKKSAVITAISSIVSSINGKINSTISAGNWALKQFGSDKKLQLFNYANGTDGHKGGNALVNDGRGAELVQMPNGNTFIPHGKNVFIPNAPKGMKVLPAEQTAALMGKNSPTFNYAKGTGDIDVWSYADNPSGLVSKLNSKFVDYKGLRNGGLNIAKGAVSTISKEMTPWIKKLFDEFGALSLANYVAGKGVEQWRSTVIRALQMEGLYSEANVKRTLYQMQTESGGNPRAINLWDSNAKKGTPSKGLMQCIDPTFKSYARPGFDKNIYDPLSNILASIRYARARYGSLERAYQGHGYANGGIATRPSIFGENGAEMAIPLSKDKRKRALSLWEQTGSMLGMTYTPESTANTASSSTTIENNNYAPEFNLTISGTNSDRETERKVKRWINEALTDVFDSIGRKNPRLREV